MNNMTTIPILGIDIGRVIISAAATESRPDTSFLTGGDGAALATPAVEGAIESISVLVQALEGRVWLISKCGPRIEGLTRKWLAHQRFFALTGVREDRVRFCLQRPEKRDHCAEIGVTHFVDDRLDVLAHLRGAVPHLFWFDPKQRRAPPWVQQTADWTAARQAILGLLS